MEFLTLEIELGALVEETQALGTRARGDEVGEDTASNSGVDVGGVAGVDGLVAAGQLSLVTTLGLGLLDGHVGGDVPAAGIVALVLDAVLGRSGSGQGGDGEDDGGQRELHCDGVG